MIGDGEILRWGIADTRSHRDAAAAPDRVVDRAGAGEGRDQPSRRLLRDAVGGAMATKP